MKKKISELKNDKAAEDFLEQDLSDYISKENFVPVKFEFMAKTKTVNMRFPDKLLEAIKKKAKKHSMPYQRYIRQILEQDIIKPI